MDDEYEEEDSSGKKGFFAKLLQSITNMSGMDKVMTATGAAVVVLAVITAAVYISAAGIDREIDQLATVGTALQGAEIPGNSGMVALADAKLAKYAAAQAALEAENQEEELKEYNESDYNRNVTVTLSMVSVYKDLKIKFTNNDSGKLISNVPFTVTLTTPSGKTETWTDDDQDGIIYKKDIEAGTYKVSVNALTDEKYSGYSLPSSAQSAEVKSEIAYKKIDVQNEIKKESEVNVAKEDTAKKDTVVESTIQDTVTWVESTEVTSTYREVLKSSITDPMTLAKSGSFMRMAEVVSVSEGDVTTQPSDTSQDEKAIVLDKTSATAYIDETAVITAALTGASVNEVKAASSDTAVAEVSVSGNTVTVKGKAAGSVTITITHPDKEDVTATCAVTVKNSPKTDKTTKLKDNSGNQLYVYENDAYREAVYADYYTFDSFYIKGDVKYTGWQTIDDKVYFYNGDGTKVTGEAVIQGVKYNIASDGTLVTGSGTMGIDVSKWNGTIDWNAVKNSGVSYVIIRCGYRGSSQGALIDDSTFATNIKGATAAGLKVGVYFFTQAVDEVEAVEEASMVLDRVSGYKISYPIFLDVEPSGGRGDKISADTRTAVCKAFCATIQNAGYTAGIYANKTWLTSKLNASSLSSYKIWLAQYAASPTYTGRYDMWQYKSTGKVSGISGNVDMNISYLGY
jgi:GH25 family lysozyme M1 (1,4-beta-N-acetylmuramidase)